MLHAWYVCTVPCFVWGIAGIYLVLRHERVMFGDFRIDMDFNVDVSFIPVQSLAKTVMFTDFSSFQRRKTKRNRKTTGRLVAIATEQDPTDINMIQHDFNGDVP